jgi:long-chain fatty acid transport protein
MFTKLVPGTVILSLCLVLAGAKKGMAGGYVIPHQTSRGLGLSNALTAGVDDASAVYYNPAALSEVQGDQFLASGIYIHVASSVENSGRKVVNKHDDNYLATLFASYHIPGTDFTLGLGSYSPFGLATTYEDDLTRFAARKTELKPIYVTPALSWHPSRQFSVGAGLSFVHASGLLSRSLCFASVPGGCGFEGKLRITDAANAFTYNLGLLWKPNDRIKFGFSYRARADLRFDSADVKFDALAPAKTSAKISPIPLPPVINAGLFWQISPAWGVEFVYEFTRWSEFKHLKASFSSPIVQGPLFLTGFSLPQDWRDTSTLRLGTFYKITDRIEVRTGIGLDETPIPSKTLSPAIPGADVLTLNAGIGYQWGKVNLDLGYMAVFYKTRRVSNQELEGIPATGIPFLGAPGKDKYETFNNFVALTLGYRF